MLNAGEKWRSGGISFGSEELHSFDPVVVQVAYVDSVRVPVQNQTFVRDLGAFFKALDALRPRRRLEAALRRGAAGDGSDFAAADNVALFASFSQFSRHIACSVD